MTDKYYDVEFCAMTYRTYDVKASSEEEARKLALHELKSDYQVDEEWIENSKVSQVEQLDEAQLSQRPWLTHEDEDRLDPEDQYPIGYHE
jgi:hypothetical protein